MKIDSLLNKLELIRIEAEETDPDTSLISCKIVDVLLEYIDNPKVVEKIDEIPF